MCRWSISCIRHPLPSEDTLARTREAPASLEVRVWDTTADTRYMVLPMQPPATIGWPVQKLATIVKRPKAQPGEAAILE